MRNSIEEIKKTLSEDHDFKEAFGSRMEKLDISLEGVKTITEALTQQIGDINQKLETLEAESEAQKMHGSFLMDRQDVIEEQLQKLKLSSCTADGAVDFNEGLVA